MVFCLGEWYDLIGVMNVLVVMLLGDDMCVVVYYLVGLLLDGVVK